MLVMKPTVWPGQLQIAVDTMIAGLWESGNLPE